MAKKNLYFAEAERLYITENMSLDMISAKFKNISVRTLQTWKQEYNWDIKRAEFAKGKNAFHAELYQLARKLMKKIESSIEAGENPDQNSVTMLKNILPLLAKVKEYEETTSTKEDKEPIDGEQIVKLIREAMFKNDD